MEIDCKIYKPIWYACPINQKTKAFFERKKESMEKLMKPETKYIFYDSLFVYAIYYKHANTIYYNLNFKGITHIIVFKP